LIWSEKYRIAFESRWQFGFGRAIRRAQAVENRLVGSMDYQITRALIILARFISARKSDE